MQERQEETLLNYTLSIVEPKAFENENYHEAV